MAEKLKGISLGIGLDISEFKSGLNEIKRQITLATDAVKFWKRELKIDPSNTVYLQKFNEALDQLSDISQEAKEKVSKLFEEFSKAGTSPSDERLKATVRELDSLDNTINKAIPCYREFGDNIQKTNGQLDNAKYNLDSTSESASRLADIIKGNLLSDAIESGLRKIVDLTKQLADGYLSIMKNGVEYNANMEKFSVSMHAIGEANGETTESIDKLIGSMKELGSKSAFGVDSLLEVSQQLMASGISADEAGKDITNLAKILAYAGKGSDELKRMAQNMNQIKNAGKAMSTDLKQFAYAGVPVYKLLADSSDRFKTITKDTIVTYDDLAKAFSVAGIEGSMYFDAIELQASTYAGQLQILKNNWDILTGVIAQDATQALAEHFLPAANEALEAMNKGFQENGWSGLFEALVKSISDFATDLAEAYPKFEPFITGIKDIVEKYKQPIEEFAGRVRGFITSEEFQTSLTTILGLVVDDLVGIMERLQLIGDWFSEGTLGKIIGFISTVHGWAKDLSDALWDVANALITIWNFFSDNKRKIAEDFSSRTGLGGITQSGGFGYQSGGFGNTITLNASFTANGSLDESQALRFANLMAKQINEELGQMV